MRTSEGVAGQRHLGEDTKDDRQDKMSGGRTMDRTTEELSSRRAQGRGCTPGGSGSVGSDHRGEVRLLAVHDVPLYEFNIKVCL